MRYDSVSAGEATMSNDPVTSAGFAKQQWALEALATEINKPIEEVASIYKIEHQKLELVARIKTYVPVIAQRQVKLFFRASSSATAIE